MSAAVQAGLLRKLHQLSVQVGSVNLMEVSLLKGEGQPRVTVPAHANRHQDVEGEAGRARRKQ